MAHDDDSLQSLLFEALVSHSQNIIGAKDLDGRYIYVNVSYSATFGVPCESFLGKTDDELFPPDIASHLRAADRRARYSQSSLVLEEVVPVQGELRTYLSVKFPILDQQGAVYATGLIATDISRWRRAEDKLRRSEELFRQAFDKATIGMCLVSLDGVLLRVNPQMCWTLGYDKDELEGRPASDFVHPQDSHSDPAYVRHDGDGAGAWSEFERHYRHKNGTSVWCRVSSSLVRGALGEPLYYISHVNDITASRHMEQELKRLASTDPLTGIANRRPFLEALEQALQRMRRCPCPVCCVMVDLDHFKHINDQFGHLAGDQVLQTFTHLCLSRLRSTDLIGRLGGEEFGILMPDTDIEGARQLAEELRKIIEETPIQVEGHRITLTISLGITECRTDDSGPDAVLSRTDQALYLAKSAGRNRYCCLDSTVK